MPTLRFFLSWLKSGLGLPSNLIASASVIAVTVSSVHTYISKPEPTMSESTSTDAQVAQPIFPLPSVPSRAPASFGAIQTYAPASYKVESNSPTASYSSASYENQSYLSPPSIPNYSPPSYSSIGSGNSNTYYPSSSYSASNSNDAFSASEAKVASSETKSSVSDSSQSASSNAGAFGYFGSVSPTPSPASYGNAAPAVYTSNPETISAVPTAPASLLISATHENITLNWLAAVGSGTITYQISRSTSASGTFFTLADGVTNNFYNDLTAVNGTTYYYKVQASNSAGVSTASAVVSGQAIASFNLNSISGGASSATLIWPAPLGAGQYTVKYGTQSGVYDVTLTNQTSPLTISGLTPNTPYFFKVIATNDFHGSLEAANELSVTPLAQFSLGTLTQTGDGEAILNWNAVNGATKYSVKIGTTAGVYTQTLLNQTSPVTLTGLTASVPNYVMVTASNTNNGNLDANSTASITPLAKPTLPLSFTALATSSQVVLNWAAVTGFGTTTYKIFRAPAIGGTYTQIGTSTSPNYTDLTARNGSSYAYQVKAVNIAGDGAGSAELGALPMSTFQITSIVPGLNQATISFNPTSGADSYTIKYGTTSGSYSGSTASITSSPVLITGLTGGQVYYFAISAVNSKNGVLTSSNELSAVIPSTDPIPNILTTTATVTLNPGDNIQTAITAAADGTRILFNPGIYSVGTLINLKTGVSLRAKGNVTLVATSTNGIFRGLGVQRIEIAGFVIKGNANVGPNTTSGAIYLDVSGTTLSSDIYIHDNYFDQWNTTNDLWLWQTVRTYIQRNTFTNGYQGVSWRCNSGSPAMDTLVVSDNVFTELDRMGFETGFSCTVTNLHIDRNRLDNIGAYVGASWEEGISLSIIGNVDSGTMDGNIIHDVFWAIEFGNGSTANYNMTITNNKMTDVIWGFGVSRAPGSVEEGNIFTRVRYPFSEDGGYQNITWIGSNTVSGSTVSGWSGNGSSAHGPYTTKPTTFAVSTALTYSATTATPTPPPFSNVFTATTNVTINPGDNIQTAINNATDGTRITFNPGIYTVSTLINLKTGVSLKANRDVTLQATGTTIVFRGLGVSRIEIAGFDIKGPLDGGAPATSGAIYIGADSAAVFSSDIYIHDNVFEQWNTTNDLWLWQTNRTYVQRNLFKDGLQGVSWRCNAGTPNIDTLVVTDNTFTQLDRMGFETGFYCTVTNVHIDRNQLDNIGYNLNSTWNQAIALSIIGDIASGTMDANIFHDQFWSIEFGNGSGSYNVTITNNVMTDTIYALGVSRAPGSLSENNVFIRAKYPFGEDGGYDNSAWVGSNIISGVTTSGWSGSGTSTHGPYTTTNRPASFLTSSPLTY